MFIGSSSQRSKKTSDADTLFSVSLSAVHPNDDGFLVVSDDLLPVYTPLGKETELLGESTSLQGLMGPVCLFSEPLSSSAVQQLSATSKPALTVLLLCSVVTPQQHPHLHVRTSYLYFGCPSPTFDQFCSVTCVYILYMCSLAMYYTVGPTAVLCACLLRCSSCRYCVFILLVQLV